MVRHSKWQLVKGKKDEWIKHVARDWFDSGNTERPDVFFERAETFLQKGMKGRQSWGAKILGQAIESASYVVFLRMEALLGLLLREYCCLQRCRAASAQKQMQEDLSNPVGAVFGDGTIDEKSVQVLYIYGIRTCICICEYIFI